jgi:PPOX class probable F420-dependent enzyme
MHPPTAPDIAGVNAVPPVLTAEVRAFLDSPRFAVMATINGDGSVAQSVVWYMLRGDRILINTRRGRRKDRNLRRDPRLSFCVEDGYRWVTLTGTVEIIDDQAVAQPDMLEITRLYKEPDEAQLEFETLYSRQERVSILLSLDGIVTYGFDR